MSTELALTPIHGEPRVHDVHLAERLGFDRPLNIRNLIKRNHAKLARFGILSAVKRIHEGAGRPTSEYYLNQKQAIFVCMKSETEKAFDVQVEIVHVFDAYLKGGLKPVPNFANPAEAARAWALEYERSQALQQEIEANRPKIAFHDQVVGSEALIDFTALFSLLQRKTGQAFNRTTFLQFCRLNGIACHANPHAGVGIGRFIPRKDYVGSWFVAEMHPNGVTEWMVRPLAVAGIVRLIELERSAIPVTMKALTAGGAQ